ncbi:hypothetical protein B4119_0929 [Parageobacillus caldoxylosilyticus]|uniref:Uncharacterized protein n=1 Tax=Saccharococcus caldoxylosilyticus TaxID=81408 RepID=A0A150LM28_9BACL|nr:hypothetical protein B4119_0929 [Parageobacillus caldoxylosilyticus]
MWMRRKNIQLTLLLYVFRQKPSTAFLDRKKGFSVLRWNTN